MATSRAEPPGVTSTGYDDVSAEGPAQHHWMINEDYTAENLLQFGPGGMRLSQTSLANGPISNLTNRAWSGNLKRIVGPRNYCSSQKSGPCAVSGLQFTLNVPHVGMHRVW